jgi:hypothetical protein
VTNSTDTTPAPGQLALDKAEAAETIARFYARVQRYDTDGSGWESIPPLFADTVVYLTQNLRDPTPVPREQFLARFREIHDVHARGQRGSFYALSGPVATIDGDTARVYHHLAVCHWLSPANEHATWFYGAADARLVRAESGWRIAQLDVSQNVRVDGHRPPIDAFHPDLEES